MLGIYGLNAIYDGRVRFSWKLEGKGSQKSYEICLYDENEKVVWDSGRISSSKRHGIYAECKLESETKYNWKVTVTDEAGVETGAEGDWFYTEICEWKAQWVEPTRVRKPLTDVVKPIRVIIEQQDPADKIDPVLYMRRTFTLESLPKKARIFVTAHGIYKLYINGKRVSSDLFAPGYTSYAKRLEYQCYDVAEYLVLGENVIGAQVADGWYTGKTGSLGIGQQYGTESALLFQLQMNTDGMTKSVISDESVKWTEGAWRYADLWIGACYDENKECQGWNLGGYDDSAWENVKIKDFGYDNLKLQSLASVKETCVITPKVITAPDGSLLLDAGVNIVGHTAFSLELKKGDCIKMEHSEILDKEGNFYRNITGQNKNQTDVYYCGHDGENAWEPEFTFHGFRYVKVSGTTDKNPEHYKIKVIGTPLTQTGFFKCSDERLNQLHDNILRSQRGNMISIPTDCPQREKSGWTGDMQIYAPTGCLEMDIEQFLRHWMVDVENEQLPDGQVPHIVPYQPSHDIMKPEWLDGVSAGGWSDAAIIVPWRLYEYYGDKTILEDNYQLIDRYMESLQGRVSQMPKDADTYSPERRERMKYIWNTDFQYGDWLTPSVAKLGIQGPEATMLTGIEVGTLMYAYTTSLMVKVCEVLGKAEKAEFYRQLNDRVCEAYRAEFLNEDGSHKKDYHGIYVLALAMNAVDAERKDACAKKLVELIHKNDDLLDCGFLSIAFLLPTLVKHGYRELANKLLFNDREPSWLYEVKMGATTIWESWNVIDEEGNPKERSLNHFAFGCVGEYLFSYIAGLQFLEPGFGKVRIEPDLSCGLSNVEICYDSIWGKIKVAWSANEDGKALEVQLPPDVEGELVWQGKLIKMDGQYIKVSA